MQEFYKCIIATAICSAAAVANCQTVTVAQSGTPNYTTIQAAIDSFPAGEDTGAPNIIQITDSALYDEVITVGVPVTIEGTGPSSPIIAAKANAVGRAGSAGIVVNLPSTITSGSVTLRNLTVIPSLTATPQSCALNVVNNNAFLFLDKVIISGNDGTNLPISTTGLTNIAALPAHINFGDDGVVAGDTDNGQFEGAGVEILLRDTVITHLRGNVDTTTLSDGVLLNNTAGTGNRVLRLADGNVISGMNGKGLNIFGDLDINSLTNRTIIAFNSSFGIWFHDSPNFRNIKGAIISGNQVGIYESSDTGKRVNMERSIVATQTRQNFRVGGNSTEPMSFKNVTIGRATSAGYATFRLDPNAASNVSFDNCIIAGNGRIEPANTLENLSTGTIHFTDCAVVEGGPLTLARPYADNSYVTGNVNIVTDPNFVQNTTFTGSDFYDVQSGSYANMGTGGTPLSGGADYVGPAATGPATEQIVTVSKSGPAGFTTVQAALDSLSLDPSKKYTVQILDSSVYDEIMTMDVPATIIGTGLNRPILAVQPNAAGFDNDGTGATAENHWEGNAGFLIDIPVSVTTCTVGLKNLIFIPSKTQAEDPVAAIVNKANNFYLEMENVLVTGNNGSDAPISTNGMSLVPSDPAHRHFKVSGGHIGSITNNRPEGDGVEVRMSNCIFTNIQSIQGGSWRTGFYMYRTYYATAVAPGAGSPLRPTAFRHLTIDDQCMFTFNSGNGLRTAASMNIITPAARSYFVGNGYVGVWLDMQKGLDRINGAVISDNKTIGINEGVGSQGPRVNLQNAIVANNGSYGSYNRLGGTTQAETYFKNVTVANNSLLNSHNQIQTSNGSALIRIRAVDSILAGNGLTTDTANIINMASGGTFTWESTAIVNAGPQALDTPSVVLSPGATTPQTIVGTPVTEADPNFANTTDAFAADFFAVRNADYATLNSQGGPLSGGGLFAPPAASVGSWSLY